MFAKVPFDDLIWQSDWEGHEVGYLDVSIVGLWKLADTNLYFYINLEDNSILEYWQED